MSVYLQYFGASLTCPFSKTTASELRVFLSFLGVFLGDEHCKGSRGFSGLRGGFSRV